MTEADMAKEEPCEGDSEVRRHLIPKVFDTNYYFGDPWGRGSKLEEKGWKKTFKDTFLQIWTKEVSGTVVEIGYDAQSGLQVIPYGKTHEAFITTTQYTIDFGFPEGTASKDRHNLLLDIFNRELKDLFELASAVPSTPVLSVE